MRINNTDSRSFILSNHEDSIVTKLVVYTCRKCGKIQDIDCEDEGVESAFALHSESFHPKYRCNCASIGIEKIAEDVEEFKESIKEFGEKLDEMDFIYKKNYHLRKQDRMKPPIPGLRNHYGKKRKHR